MRRQIISFFCFLLLFSIVRYSLRAKKGPISVSQKETAVSKAMAEKARAGRAGRAKVRLLLDEGLRLINEGSYQKALAKYNAVYEIEPNNAQAHHGMGISYYRMGKLSQAITEFRKAAVLSPDYARPHHALGRIYRDNKEYAEAIAEYRRAAELGPDEWSYWYDLGFTYRITGRGGEALSAYKKALSINPQSALTILSIGDVYLFLLKDLEMAEKRYKEGLALNPQNADIYNNLGHIREKKGKKEEAKVYYRQALKLDPSNKNARHNLNRLALLAYKAEVEAVEQPRSLDMFKSAPEALTQGSMTEREFITLLEERVIPESREFAARFSQIKPGEPKLAAIHQKGVQAVDLKYHALVRLLQGTIARDKEIVQESKTLIDQAQAKEAEFLKELGAYSNRLQ